MPISSVSGLESPWSVLLDQTPLQLDGEGIKEREDGERGGGGRLFKGGDYFKYFRLKGAIIPGRQLIERQLLFKETQYFVLNLFFIATYKEKNPAAGW